MTVRRVIPVRVGSRTYQTRLDRTGVQRFTTGIPRVLVELALQKWLKRTGRTEPLPEWICDQPTLNRIQFYYCTGVMPLEQYMRLTRCGSSVSGMSDSLSSAAMNKGIVNPEIQNPLWDA